MKRQGPGDKQRRHEVEMGAEDKEKDRRKRTLQLGDAGEKVSCLYSISP